MVEKRKLSRREQDRQRHKKAIIEVAMRLFSEKGFHNVSVQEIAAEAEFATGTLYNFFAGKGALYQEIMTSCGDSCMKVILPILDGAEAEREKVSCFIRSGVRAFRENTAAIKLFLQENQGRTLSLSGAPVHEVNKGFREVMLTKLTEVFAAGVRKGVFRPLDPRVVALSLLASLEAMIFSAAEDTDDAALDQGVVSLEALFLRGILHVSNQEEA